MTLAWLGAWKRYRGSNCPFTIQSIIAAWASRARAGGPEMKNSLPEKLLRSVQRTVSSTAARSRSRTRARADFSAKIT